MESEDDINLRPLLLRPHDHIYVFHCCCFPNFQLISLMFFFYFFFVFFCKVYMKSVFQGLVFQQISSRRSCGKDGFRKLHICWGFHVNCQQNINAFFNNEKQEEGWLLEMVIHTFFIKTREEGRVRTLLMLNHPHSGHSPCIHSFLCLRAHSSAPYAALARSPQFKWRSR